MQLPGAHKSLVGGAPFAQHSASGGFANVHELKSLHPLESGHGCPVAGGSVIQQAGVQPLHPRSPFFAHRSDFPSQGLPAQQPKHCWAKCKLASCPLLVASSNMLEVCLRLQGPF